MRYRTAWIGTALAAAVTLGACGTARAPMAGDNAFAESMTTVRVKNDNWADVAVYMVRSGVKMRIGTASGLGTTEIRVNEAMLGPGGTVVFIADPVGSRFGFRSDPIVFTPGSTAEVRLGSNLRMSSVIVF